MHTLNMTNPVLRSYDIFAVRPTSEKAFQAACLTLEGVDIISLDLSTRLPFQLKRPYIFGALARGVSFEISYGSALRGVFVCAMRRIFFGMGLVAHLLTKLLWYFLRRNASQKPNQQYHCIASVQPRQGRHCHV